MGQHISSVWSLNSFWSHILGFIMCSWQWPAFFFSKAISYFKNILPESVLTLSSSNPGSFLFLLSFAWKLGTLFWSSRLLVCIFHIQVVEAGGAFSVLSGSLLSLKMYFNNYFLFFMVLHATVLPNFLLLNNKGPLSKFQLPIHLP